MLQYFVSIRMCAETLYYCYDNIVVIMATTLYMRPILIADPIYMYDKLFSSVLHT